MNERQDHFEVEVLDQIVAPRYKLLEGLKGALTALAICLAVEC